MRAITCDFCGKPITENIDLHTFDNNDMCSACSVEWNVERKKIEGKYLGPMQAELSTKTTALREKNKPKAVSQ
jgi:hypothetical protein